MEHKILFLYLFFFIGSEDHLTPQTNLITLTSTCDFSDIISLLIYVFAQSEDAFSVNLLTHFGSAHRACLQTLQPSQ